MSVISGYNWAYLEEGAKRAVRRALLKAVCLPGHQVPFASRDMPVARGWGSGGLQVTLASVVPGDTVKVIDQGDDNSLNAVAIRDLVAATTDVATTTDARRATLIQTRHRIPEDYLDERTTLVFQVPIADPLRILDAKPSVTRRLHSEGDYTGVWLYLYEDTARMGRSSFAHSHPVWVGEPGRGWVMSPSPVPRYDLPRLHQAPFLSLYGAGREATVYAIPPYTDVHPLAFADRPFEVETAAEDCRRCGSRRGFRVEEDGGWACSDTDHCRRTAAGRR